MVFKKLKAIGKKRKCKQLGEKAQSLLKQQYWCAATSEGDGDLVSEKWLSIYPRLYHICAWVSWREIHYLLTRALVDRY